MMTVQFSMYVEPISCTEILSSLELQSSPSAETFDHQPSKGALLATCGAGLALSLTWRSPLPQKSRGKIVCDCDSSYQQFDKRTTKPSKQPFPTSVTLQQLPGRLSTSIRPLAT